MNTDILEEYKILRNNGFGYYKQKRGIIEVSGKEAVQFLNGLLTNDVAKLEDFSWMAAAFPNAQGRLLGIVRVLRFSDKNADEEKTFFDENKFIFETEEATYEKILQNLSRFTLAGDFYVNDLTEKYSCVSVRGDLLTNSGFPSKKYHPILVADPDKKTGCFIHNIRGCGFDYFVPNDKTEDIINGFKKSGAIEISAETQEILRVEQGIPLYGVDMDETTIVPEIGLPDVISYSKGCYIGQEIIARIHFRGHIAKQLTGLIFENDNVSVSPNDELKSLDGKNAGKITSVTFSPKLEKIIALGYVRYDYLTEGTELKIGDQTATVKDLPFVE